MKGERSVSTRNDEWISEQFEEQRAYLRSVAYRMLGSLTEADDALQEAWLRLSRSDTQAIENPRAWLTTVVARVCLNMLRARRAHGEESLDDDLLAVMPQPIVTPDDGSDPEHAAEMADSVGLALLVVLQTLGPAERLAFVLHDVFGVSFEEIATIVDRSPMAARQLATRARQRIRNSHTQSDADLAGQRAVVNAFLAASRDGDFQALLEVLDPDVVLRTDVRTPPAGGLLVLRGAELIAARAKGFSAHVATVRPALVNGAAGLVSWTRGGQRLSIMAFTVRNGKIVAMDVITSPDRLAAIDLSGFGA
ncbi:MAG: sigma-70 family RNA polymerase sigma factor [Chloroflexi bacterium]|nr:sigma-70 family RNA polymerase sigma factor [Chloroflexota bacterium]